MLLRRFATRGKVDVRGESLMRFVACALVVAGIAFFASGCCCNPFACLPTNLPGLAPAAAADRAHLDAPASPAQVAVAHVDAGSQRY